MSRFVYLTAANREEARRIGRALVEEKLVACVNIIEGIHSIYEWEGELHEESECALIAKTSAELADAVVARVVELHTYQCPCVVVLPVEQGNPAFLEWVSGQLREGGN